MSCRSKLGRLPTLPLADRVADVVLDVFTPRNPSEFQRVLRPTGRLIVVRPAERHLAELRGQVPAMVTIDPDKEQRLHKALDPFFEAADTQRVEYVASLARQEALDLVGMAPSARHMNRADLNSNGLLPDQATTYRPRRPRHQPRWFSALVRPRLAALSGW